MLGYIKKCCQYLYILVDSKIYMKKSYTRWNSVLTGYHCDRQWHVKH